MSAALRLHLRCWACSPHGCSTGSSVRMRVSKRYQQVALKLCHWGTFNIGGGLKGVKDSAQKPEQMIWSLWCISKAKQVLLL